MPAQTWNQFVKEIQLERQVPRKEAMKIASPLWQKQKVKKAAKKKVKVPPTISEFPKAKKKTRTKAKSGTRVAVPATVAARASELGGAIDPYKKVTRGKKRLVKKHFVLEDSQFRFLSRQSGVNL